MDIDDLEKAVNYIDNGQYDRFEQMMQTSLKVSDEEIQAYKEAEFHPDFSKSPDEELKYFLTDNVQTLTGMKYLEQNNLIPNDYFTDEDRVSDPVLYFASPEQIDFYVAHGTDVNARAIAVRATTLDYAVLEGYSPETVEKLLSVGCVTAYGKKFYFGIDSEDKEIHSLLKNIAVLLKHDFKPEKGWFAELSRDKHKDLFKKYPDLMAEIMSYDDRTNIQKVKDRIRDKNKQKEERRENLKQVKSMTHDIKLGMKITEGKDYDYLSEEARRHAHTKKNIEDSWNLGYKYVVSNSEEMKNAKDNDIIAYDRRKRKVITVKFPKDNGIEK